MSLTPGTHTVGPAHGNLRVHTYREGMAQKVGHDLIIHVAQWQATLEVSEEGTLRTIRLEADPRSLQVLEGHRGVKPLTDKDRGDIRSNIDEKILGGQPITFTSTSTELRDGRLFVEGELTLAGTTRRERFELEVSDAGQVSGSLPVVQSQWGIKPYRAFMGALQVRDAVEIVIGMRRIDGVDLGGVASARAEDETLIALGRAQGDQLLRAFTEMANATANDGALMSVGDYRVGCAVEFAETYWRMDHGQLSYEARPEQSTEHNAHLEVTVLDGLTGRQRVFHNWGLIWRIKTRPAPTAGDRFVGRSKVCLASGGLVAVY